MKNRLIKIGDKEFKTPRKRHTDHVKIEKADRDSKKRKSDFHKAGKMWLQFKMALAKTETRPQDLAGRFMALRDRIRKEISNRRVRALCLEMCDDAVTRAHALFGDQENLTSLSETPINNPPPEMPEK